MSTWQSITRPIQTIHGLQNYSNMKLGDERCVSVMVIYI